MLEVSSFGTTSLIFLTCKRLINLKKVAMHHSGSKSGWHIIIETKLEWMLQKPALGHVQDIFPLRGVHPRRTIMQNIMQFKLCVCLIMASSVLNICFMLTNVRYQIVKLHIEVNTATSIFLLNYKPRRSAIFPMNMSLVSKPRAVFKCIIELYRYLNDRYFGHSLVALIFLR